MVLHMPSTLYFVVHSKINHIYGYTWRIGTSGTSFYIKARAPYIAVKISLHGPDPRPHLSQPGFKVALDRSALPKVRAAGGAVMGVLPEEGQWFSGRQIRPNVRHVMTFRSNPDLFVRGVTSGPSPGQFNASREQGLVVPAPQALKAADVDLFISDDFPYWHNPIKSFSDNANLGPIQNKAGQFLTCQSVVRPAAKCTVAVPEPATPDDRVRGLVTYINGQGVLVIQEHWMSRSFFTENAHAFGLRNELAR
jgi:hypothetical protein